MLAGLFFFCCNVRFYYWSSLTTIRTQTLISRTSPKDSKGCLLNCTKNETVTQAQIQITYKSGTVGDKKIVDFPDVI